MTKKILLCFIFFAFSPVLVFSLIFSQSFLKNGLVLGDSVSGLPDSRVLYASMPSDTGVIVPVIKHDDSTLVIIEKYLSRYSSPLLPFSQLIVSESRRFGVDPRLIVAIAQQESNLGKSSPEGCFNAWGWGIHARGTKCFSDWEKAITSVISGISGNYCKKGYCDDPCVMMKKYTPQSNGSWCAGVNQFLTEMENGDF